MQRLFPFDLGFLAMALTRLGIACPLHSLYDTLDMTRRLYSACPSHSLEHVATRLEVANKAEHRALSNACLVKDVLLEWLRRTPTVTSKGDLVPLSPPSPLPRRHPPPARHKGAAPHAPPVPSREVRPAIVSCCLATRTPGWGGLFQPHILIGG
jgi:DNA polymerase III epsilon subunit-like protein